MDPEELVREYKRTLDLKLREQVTVNFLSYVKYILGRMHLNVDSATDLEDIESAGVIGLLQALDDYNPERQTKFSTYAAWRIKGAILDHLRRVDYVSRNDRAKIKQIEQCFNDLTNQLGREPSVDEITEKLNLDLREYNRILELVQLNFSSSLEQTQFINGEEVRLSDVIPDTHHAGPAEEFNKKELLRLVADAIGKLEQREQAVIAMYYVDEMTLSEIGKVLNLSESRVSRVLGNALLKVRTGLKEWMTIDV